MVREALTPEKVGALEPRDAAAYFIVRRAEGLTVSEQHLLSSWLASDEAHRRLFESADRAWQTFGESQDDEILKAMRAHALAPPPRVLAGWRPAAAAAIILLLLAGAAMFFFPALNPWSPERLDPVSGAPILYASARGEVKEVRLPDGSRMTLDADSAAVGRFNDSARSIQLKRGRAFFAVTPDRSRPFAVTAAGRRIVALGTRFDVNLAADGLTVTLLDGLVEVASQDPARAPVTLEPGQQYVERPGKATVRTVGPASENAIGWRVGLIRFDDLPLAEAAAVMNRYSSEQIVIRDPGVGALRISGQFRAGETQRFAATLAEMHGLRPVRRANEVELLRAK